MEINLEWKKTQSFSFHLLFLPDVSSNSGMGNLRAACGPRHVVVRPSEFLVYWNYNNQIAKKALHWTSIMKVMPVYCKLSYEEKWNKEELQNKSVYSGQVIFLVYVFMIMWPSATQKWYNAALSWQKVAHPCSNWWKTVVDSENFWGRVWKTTTTLYLTIFQKCYWYISSRLCLASPKVSGT